MLRFHIKLRIERSWQKREEWVVEAEYTIEPPVPDEVILQLKTFTVKKGAYTCETGSTERIPLDAAKLYDLLVEGYEQVRIPIVGLLLPGGLDGTSYELEYHHSFGHVKFRWWSDSPSELKSLSEWFNKMLAFLYSAKQAHHQNGTTSTVE